MHKEIKEANKKRPANKYDQPWGSLASLGKGLGMCAKRLTQQLLYLNSRIDRQDTTARYSKLVSARDVQ